jgi:uncharacterized phage-associated protein
MVQFEFDADKTIAAALYIASRNLPELTMGKLFKLLFFADKDHLVRYGRPITGDWYAAMKDGPVPSNLYNLFKEVREAPKSDCAKSLAKNIKLDSSKYQYPRIIAQASADQMQLSKSDILSLDRVLKEYGKMSFTKLRAITHDTPAYENAWELKPELKDSEPMVFEDFFEDDANALTGTKDEMLENYRLKVAFEK